MNALGQKLRSARSSRGWSLGALAGRVGVSKAYLSMIENDRVAAPPSGEVLSKLESALGLEAGALAREADWLRTPATVRERVRQLDAEARRVRAFARWLGESTSQHAGGGKNLDRLFRSGQLTKRVNRLLAGDETSATGADLDPGGGEASGEAGQAASPGGASAGTGTGPQTSEGGASEGGASEGGASGGTTSGGGASGGGASGGETSGGETSGGGISGPRGLPGGRIPLINRVAAGYPSGFTDLDYPARVADDYVSAPVTDPDAFAATVVGGSMLPEYRAGDIVIFSPATEVDDGADCFVRIEPDHETTFKRVYFDHANGLIRLQPLNPSFEARVLPRDQVAGLYRAVWRMSPLV